MERKEEQCMAGWREAWGSLIVEDSAVIWEGEGELLRLEAWGEDGLRFRSSKSLRLPQEDWGLLEPKASNGVIQWETSAPDQPKSLRISNGGISALVEINGTVSYYKSSGELLLQESWIDKREERAPHRRAREYRHHSSESFRTSLYFKAHRDEHFYGMGQVANDCFDLKGTVVELFQKNGHCVIPFLLSSRGYGFIWNNPAVGQVELVHNHTRWFAEACKGIDYVVFAGDDPDAIVRTCCDLTGHVPMLPDHAAGFWQCKLRYRSQEELLEVAREYRKRDLPLSVIVIDYFHWTEQGEWKFDPRFWPDPAAMVKELEEMGIKVMVSVWPTVDPSSENYTEMAESNCLIRSERGLGVFFMFEGPETYVDTTNPRARSSLWTTLKKNYWDHGIRMFWLDEAEPEIRPYDYDQVRYFLGNGLEVSNCYPFHFAQALWEGQISAGQKPGEIVNLIRCAWTGSQRFGAVLWSGDIEPTFDSLRKQIKAGLNVSLCGQAWWTTDIGGFLGGNPADPAYRELMIRWFQFGTFSPIMRLHGFRLPWLDPLPGQKHGSGGPNEVWSYGKEAFEIMKEHLRLREKLRPYILEQMAVAHRSGRPVMRPLFLDFPADQAAWEVDDQYMFGPDILVSPVITAGAEKRTVYLPEGSGWIEAASGRQFTGGSSIEVETPLSRIPLFLRKAAVADRLSGAAEALSAYMHPWQDPGEV
jgi:alpha-D-xyloside xylohydrolase